MRKLSLDIGFPALLGCALVVYAFGWAWGWAAAFLWAAAKAVEHDQRADRWQHQYEVAASGAPPQPIIPEEMLKPDDDRGTRINGKLKAQVTSLQKINTDLNDEIRKRDRIIATLRESKPQKGRVKTA